MALRLSHVLVLMALVLAAGVLSVQSLEQRVGGTAVQGTLVIAAPGLRLQGAQQLQRERADARWTVLAAGDGWLSPFDDGLVAERVAHGAATALFVQPPAPQDVTPGTTLGMTPDVAPGASTVDGRRAAWRVLVAPDEGEVLASLSAFVAAQSGTRPFVAGLILPLALDASALATWLEPLLAAAEGLPSFRRTSIVLLGERQSAPGVRVAVRLDRGRSALPAPVTLLDLLERDR